MDFTINSKQKKVELFYESAKEQAAIMEFISNWLTFKEEMIKYQPAYQNNEITWATKSAAHEVLNGTCSTNVLDTVSGRSETINTNKVADLISLTNSADLPSGCIHVSAKSK